MRTYLRFANLLWIAITNDDDCLSLSLFRADSQRNEMLVVVFYQYTEQTSSFRGFFPFGILHRSDAPLMWPLILKAVLATTKVWYSFDRVSHFVYYRVRFKCVVFLLTLFSSNFSVVRFFFNLCNILHHNFVLAFLTECLCSQVDLQDIFSDYNCNIPFP